MATFSNPLLAKIYGPKVPFPVVAPAKEGAGKPLSLNPVEIFQSIAYDLNSTSPFPASLSSQRQVKKIASEGVPVLNLHGIRHSNDTVVYDIEDTENGPLVDRDDHKVESTHSKKERGVSLPPQLVTQNEWNKILNGKYFGKPDWNLKLEKDLKRPIFISSCFYLKYPLKLIRAFIEFGFKRCNDNHILRHLIHYPAKEALNFAKYFGFFGFKETTLSLYFHQHLISKELIEPLILDSSCRDFSNSEQDVLAALQRIEKFRQLHKSIELKAFVIFVRKLCQENIDVRILKAVIDWHPVAFPFAINHILKEKSAAAFRNLLKYFPLEILLKDLAPSTEENLNHVLDQIGKFPSVKVKDSFFNSLFLKFQKREVHPQILQALMKWRPNEARVALDQLIWNNELSPDAFKNLLDLVPHELKQRFCTPVNLSKMHLVLKVLPMTASEITQAKLSVFLANGYSITMTLLNKVVFEPERFATFAAYDQIAEVLNPRVAALHGFGIKLEASALAHILYLYCNKNLDSDIFNACISWGIASLRTAIDELLSQYQLNDTALNILLAHFSLEKLLGSLTPSRRCLTASKIQRNLIRANISDDQFTYLFARLTRFRMDEECLRVILEAFPAQATEQLQMFIGNYELSLVKLENFLKQLPKEFIESCCGERRSIFSYSLAESRISIDRIKLLIKYGFPIDNNALRYVGYFEEDAAEVFGLLVDNGATPNEETLKEYLIEKVSADIILETIEMLQADKVTLSDDFMSDIEVADANEMLSKYPQLNDLLASESRDEAPA